MNKTMKKVICFIMTVCLLVGFAPSISKADSTFTMITPGYTADTAAIIPTDGTDYVATYDSQDIDDLYFKFTVDSQENIFYNVYYKNLSVNTSTTFTIYSVVGENLYERKLLRNSDFCEKNWKAGEGTYILKIHKDDKTTGNIKINIAKRVDDVGDTMATATPIKGGKPKIGTLDGYRDNDYYKFVVPETGTYEFYAKNLSIEENSFWGVYSSAEELMYGRSYLYKNNDTNYGLKCTKGDVYYLRYTYQGNNTVPCVGKYKVYVKKINPGKVESLKIKRTAPNSVKISWSKATNASAYEVQISKDKKFRTYNSWSVEERNKTYSTYYNGTYYVRVRSYKQVGNTKYYGKFSPIKKVKLTSRW